MCGLGRGGVARPRSGAATAEAARHTHAGENGNVERTLELCVCVSAHHQSPVTSVLALAPRGVAATSSSQISRSLWMLRRNLAEAHFRCHAGGSLVPIDAYLRGMDGSHSRMKASMRVTSSASPISPAARPKLSRQRRKPWFGS